MRHVSLLLSENVNVAGFDNPRQALTETNSYLKSQGRNEAFAIDIVGLSDTIQTSNEYISIKADKTIDEVKHTDLIIIPPIQDDFREALMANSAFYPWICEQYQQGAQMVSLCLDAFLLAQTGLINQLPRGKPTRF